MASAGILRKVRRQKLEELPDPMRPADVAALAGVSKDLIYKEILAGRLRVKKLGGEKRPTYLITHAWYRDWLEGPQRAAQGAQAAS